MLRGLVLVMRQKHRLPILTILIILTLLSPYLMVSGQSKPITITRIRTLDMLGNERTSFARGTTVVVEVTIQSEVYAYGPPTQYLLIVEILNPQGYVVFIGFITDVIEPGATKTAGSGYQIPAGASTGTYTVKVFVWNGWPSQMGANWEALSDPGEKTFTVT
jgi:hypothetical protein